MADEDLKPLEAPITVERSFLVDGKRVTVQVKFPATLGKEIGMENSYLCAQRILVNLVAPKARLKDLKLGE